MNKSFVMLNEGKGNSYMSKYNNQYCKDLARRLSLKDLEECLYFPKYFTIETCNNCNARCTMCPKGQAGTKGMQIMEDAVFDKIVKELEGYCDWIEMICLNSDGEPLLDKKIALRIKKLKDIGIRHINISTNAQLLTKDKIEELLESGLDDLRISIDGFTKETYEKVRQGLNYDIVKANTLNMLQMRNLAKSSMKIRIRMVELEENADEREDFLKFWQSKAGEEDKIQLMPMHTWSGKIADEEKRKIDFYADKPCVSVFSSFTINYDGKVQLCDSDIEQQEIVGDIREQSIRDIWQGGKMEQIRGWHADEKRNNIPICQGCDHWSRHFKESIGQE